MNTHDQLSFNGVPLALNSGSPVYWKEGYSGNLCKIDEGRKSEVKKEKGVSSSSKDHIFK